MKNIFVVFGGRSAEHDVSIVTALIAVIPALKASGRFNVYPVYISQEGGWYCDEALSRIETFQKGDFSKAIKKVELSLENGLHLISPGIRRKQVSAGIVFPAMHGTNGEDGSLMGLLRMANIPFVGCDLFASAIAMDKVLTKTVTEAVGLPSVRYEWFTRSEMNKNEPDIRKKISKLKFPLFVKPAHLGSSIGISRAKNEVELDNAIEIALHYDDKIIIEEAVPNLIEVTVPVLGNHDIKTGLVERALNRDELFNFEEKYIHGNKKNASKSQYSELPAKIDQGLITESEKIAISAFRAIGGSGTARVDLLIDGKSKEVYLNEINTLPGSLYHHNWKAAGVSNVELVETLVDLAEEKHAEQKKNNYVFKSNILGQFK